MSFQDALLVHRAAENYHGAALMVRDPILMRLAAAWPKVKRQLPGPPPPGQEVDLESPLAENQGRLPGVGGTGSGRPYPGPGRLDGFDG